MRAPSVGGRILLRMALACGVFVVLTFTVFSRPMPGAPRWVMNLGDRTFEIGIVLGLLAPVLAIIGAILTFRAQRRLSALDWVSFALGLCCFLLPAMFVIAYSTCPNGIC